MSQWGRDPLLQLLAKEARSCKGCGHIQVAFDRQYCGKGKKMVRRCSSYIEVNKTTIQGKP